MNHTPNNESKQPDTEMKYVIVSGGVVSGLGKGITASSIGLLLKQAGLRVTAIKIDPYLNIDAGTMSPYEHGEVFVLDDGGECDLDLGNYERFLNITLTRDHNITTGKVYRHVLDTERRGDYLGKTVQIVPHITNCIQDWIERASQIPVDASGYKPHVSVIELGGTVGDIESAVFLEAIRQFKFRCGDNVCHVHVSLIPALGNVGELKSKPTQHSMIQLRSTGLIPDIVVLRCSKPVPPKIINKVSIFSMVPKENIIGIHDVENIYQVPQLVLDQDVIKMIFKKTGITDISPNIDLKDWNVIANQLTDDYEQEKKTISIGIVGKYTGLTDSYLSVTKALISAALSSQLELQIVWIESEKLELPKEEKPDKEDKKENDNGDLTDSGSTAASPDASPVPPLKGSDGEEDEDELPAIEEMKDLVHNISMYSDTSPNKHKSRNHEYDAAWDKLKSVDGILIPGGFGDRGIEGKIKAVQYARTNKVPFLGICLGLQCAVAEFCRNVMNLKDANSSEFDENTTNPVVIFMPEGDKENYGGTMRLGSRRCNLKDGSLAKYLYRDQNTIYERHRHRYEVNPKYVKQIESKGLRFTGKDEKNERMEIIELSLDQHPYFFGCQFHPEFKSGPLRPSPPFAGLIKAAAGLLYTEPKFIKQFGSIKKQTKIEPKIQFIKSKAKHSKTMSAPIMIKEFIDKVHMDPLNE